MGLFPCVPLDFSNSFESRKTQGQEFVNQNCDGKRSNFNLMFVVCRFHRLFRKILITTDKSTVEALGSLFQYDHQGSVYHDASTD